MASLAFRLYTSRILLEKKGEKPNCVQYILNFLQGSDLKIYIYEPDLEVLKASFSRLKIPDSLNVKFVHSIPNFLSCRLDRIVVNDATKALFPELYDELEDGLCALPDMRNSSTGISSSLKVLVQARGNIFKSRGGYTVALEESCKALRNLGVHVVVDESGQLSPKGFDILHLYNFATPASIEPFARRAFDADVPFVATTLYEDRPAFYAKMSVYGKVMEECLNGVLQNLPFSKSMGIINRHVNTFLDQGDLDNDFIAENASALFSSGSIESDLLRRDYPGAKKIEVVAFGFQSLPDVEPGIFRGKYNLNDYVICVGRIEWRKNQAMLVKAFQLERPLRRRRR